MSNRKLPPRKLTVHLSGQTPGGVVPSLAGMLKELDFMVTPRLQRADVAVFVDNGDGLDALDEWLGNVADVKAKPLVCMSRLSKAERRALAGNHDVKTIAPAGPEERHFIDRILGELFTHQYPRILEPFPLGNSSSMRDIQRRLDIFRDSADPVLILGESGSGKAFCADYLCRGNEKGLVTFNCGSESAELVDTTLFGCVRGTAHSKQRTRKGLLRENEGGTVMLTEIDRLTPQTQAALLKIIESGRIRPVGGIKTIELNTRLILASSADLAAATKAGTFRGDLYNLISALSVRVPPLRRRLEDLPLLVNGFLETFAKETRKKIKPPVDYDAFFGYQWPGNIRELRSLLRESVTLQSEPRTPLDMWGIEIYIFHQNAPEPPPVEHESIPFYKGKDSWPDLEQRAGRAFFRDAIQRFGGVNDRMVALAGFKKSAIYKKCDALGIDPKTGERR
ncbi:MAG: sigma 54-interacting transcriptional regulator [Acidobacteriota bacterium]|nr:sigma 54-interacting transcriptional regulator [Acidobacteriota bacterium]